MDSKLGAAFLVAAVISCLGQRPLHAQTCKDEEDMAAFYTKEINDLQQTIKKESLQDFEKAFHQKSCLTKLTLFVGALDGVMRCLGKAAQDTTATKAQVDTYKAKRERTAKLRDKIDHYKSALKGAETAKEAKGLIEKFDLVD